MYERRNQHETFSDASHSIHASQSERNVPKSCPSIGGGWARQCALPLGPTRGMGADQYPHVEMLAAWEAFLPGSTARLRAIAQSEAQHREWMAAHGVERTVPGMSAALPFPAVRTYSDGPLSGVSWRHCRHPR